MKKLTTLMISAAGLATLSDNPLLAGGGSNGITELVSLRQDGTSASVNVWAPDMSGDGRWVIYETKEALLPADTNDFIDVYAYDRWTDTLVCASTSSAGVYGNAPAYRARISENGRYVGFTTGSDNLVPLDTNAWHDVYVKDLQTGQTVRISNAHGTDESAYGASWDPWLSADGRYVAFRSSGVDLVPVDTNLHSDIFRYDTWTGDMLRVSDAPGGESNGNVWNCSMSADGSRIAFRSWASNLVPGDTNGFSDIFVVDVGGLPQLVSRNPFGDPADGSSGRPVLSADGSTLTFESWATDIAGPYNTQSDVFLVHLDTMDVELLSVGNDGLPGIGDSVNGSLSADGQFAAFISEAPGLAPFEGLEYNVYVKDVDSGETWTVGLASGVSRTANGASSTPRLSSDGSIVAFESRASNLALGDTNENWDVFVRVLHPDPEAYCSPSVTSAGCEPSLASSGYPSATADSGFTIEATDVPNQTLGLLFYGFAGQAAVPFGSGTLCVAASHNRAPLLHSGGWPPAVDDCSGSFSFDMNAFAAGAAGGNPAAALTQVGQQVNVQVLGRDAGSVFLTDAIEYVVGP